MILVEYTMQYSKLGRLYVKFILKDIKVFEIVDATYRQYSPKYLSDNDPELVTCHDILTNYHIIINNIFEICMSSILKYFTYSGVLDSHPIQK